MNDLLGDEILGPPGLTIEQQKKIAELQSQAANQSLRTPAAERFSVDRSEHSIYVGELDLDVNDSILREHFKTAINVHVCRDRVSGKSLGYAYVNFSTAEDCTNVLKNMNYSTINGRPYRLMMAEKDPSKRTTGTCNLVVKNLPTSVDEKSLYDTFSQWGNVVSCKVIKSPYAVRCYGYVNYDSISAAVRAIDIVNGAYLFGRQIEVSHQVPKSERASSFSEQAVKSQKFTNIYIKNIALDVTEDDLRELFSSIGPVSSIIIQRDDSNFSKGFGFANYESPEDAEKAIQQFHNYDYYGKKLFVTRAQKRSEREDELRRQHEYQPRIEKSPKYQGVNLYVKNLADDVDDERLREEFSRYGQITSAKVMREERSGVSKGFGFVCFASPEEATEAVVKMNGSKIASKEIYVAIAQRKEDRRQFLESQIAQQKNFLVPLSPRPQQLTPPPIIERNNNATTSAGNTDTSSPGSPFELTLASLESYSHETQRQIIGGRIYSIISDTYPQEASQLTNVLLEMDKDKLVQLINEPQKLKEKAKEAILLLY
ncbi:MAG: poly(A) binding protein [Benjaminiella poitrasii]|nr:MAG: poly(A) binding protein [Benjaminiella poitrasii]